MIGTPTRGADGKDYRTNFVHAFSEQISTPSAYTLEACGFQPEENRPWLDPNRYFMTATNNPQAAAGQASATYRNMTDKLGHLGLDTVVPEGVRSLAEKTVTREAYDRSMDAFDASLTTFER